MNIVVTTGTVATQWSDNHRALYWTLNMNAYHCGTKEKVTNYWSTWNKAIINDMSDLNNSEIASRPQKHFNELITNRYKS